MSGGRALHRSGIDDRAASRTILQHLTVAGPLAVGEMGRHLQRAQSVVSEVVDHLERALIRADAGAPTPALPTHQRPRRRRKP
jgi:hypothetical protein